MRHLTPDDIEAFVQGLVPADPAWFRAHVSTCERCARSLRNEARLEQVLLEAAALREPSPSDRHPSPSGSAVWRWAAAAGVLLVAWIAWLGWTSRPSRDAPGPAGPTASTRAETLGISLPAVPFEAIPRRADIDRAMPGYDVQAPEQFGLGVWSPITPSRDL